MMTEKEEYNDSIARKLGYKNADEVMKENKVISAIPLKPAKDGEYNYKAITKMPDVKWRKTDDSD